MAGRPPAQQRALPTRPDRGEITRLEARRSVPDAIDAAILAQQRTGSQSLLDLLGVTPARSSCPRVTTPCAAPAIRASSCSTVVLTFPPTRGKSQHTMEIRPPAVPPGGALSAVRRTSSRRFATNVDTVTGGIAAR